MQIVEFLCQANEHKYMELERLAFQDNFDNVFLELHQKLFQLEDMKYLPPKFSLSMKDL